MNQPTQAIHRSQHKRDRRRLLLGFAMTVLLPAARATAPTRVEVWKDPSCGCCRDWIAHLETQGFSVTTHDTGNRAARHRLGMPEAMASCHTALVEGYVLEGHVPAASIRRLLVDRPRALGLAVPGMPIGSPGMDGPAYQGRSQPYEVMLVAKDGKATTYEAHR